MKAASGIVATAVAVLALAGCSSGAPTAEATAPSAQAAAPQDAVTFDDVAAKVGVVARQVTGNREKRHLLEAIGTGIAVGDYDGDGDADLYLPTAQTTDDWLAGRRPLRNVLYRNDGGRFDDVAGAAGVDLAAWSSGAYFVDYDGDGDLDLFVTAWGPNVLYRNEGDGTFTDATSRAGVAGDPRAWSASAAFGDLDGDGDLDLYVTNYCVYDLANPPLGGKLTVYKGIEVYPGPTGFVGQRDVLYRNDGDGTFSDVSAAAGVRDDAPPRYGLGVVFSDLDDDGDLDIYVANDSQPNYLWRNDGGLRFTEVGALAGVATNEDAKEQAGMGVDAGDYDGDGIQDLVVTNFSHDWDTLYRGIGGLQFVDATFQAGLKDTYLDLAWGTRLVDYDSDGDLDLIVANGHIYPEVDAHPQLRTTYAQRNSLYRNDGTGRFENRAAFAGPGLAEVESTRGAAFADLDRDGDVDVVLSNIDRSPSVLVNRGGNRAAWVGIVLEGRPPNRFGVGARIVVESEGTRRVRDADPYGSYLSSGDFAVLVGLGEAAAVDRITVRWPTGGVDEVRSPPLRRWLRIAEGRGLVGADEPGEERW